MIDPILKVVDNSMREDEIRYEIFFDQEDFQQSFESKYAIEFESEKDKKSYMDKFINEELFAFGVVKKVLCKCCHLWSEVESLWGIHAESAEEALKQFKQQTS